MGKKIVLAVLLIACIAFAQSNVAASTTSPVANPPQFIVIGSDDNTNAEAIRWMADVMNSGTNYGGSKRYMTFYVNSYNSNQSAFNWETNSDLVAAVFEAYQSGHSIGNHTHTHPYFVAANGNMSNDDVRAEIVAAREAIATAGIPVEHQFGFRTPFLAYHDGVFAVLRELGFMYDHSIEAGGASGSTRFPYTLHEGSPDNTASWWANPTNPANIDDENTNARNTLVGDHPGLWTLLASNVLIDPQDLVGVGEDGAVPTDNPVMSGQELVGHRLANGVVIPTYMGLQGWGNAGFAVTGFDYNLWSAMEMDEDQTYRALMNTLNLHLNGNRAPFSFGPHSQYFFQADDAFPRIDREGRQRAFERFVEDASKLENVFFVTSDMVIRWMQNPVTAENFKPEDYFMGYVEDGTFTAVTGIGNVPTTATVNVPLTLTGVVQPAGATNKTIVWSGQGVVDGVLTATATGTVTVTATITNGASATSNYTQNFDITVSEAAVVGSFELIGWEHSVWSAYTELTIAPPLVLNTNSVATITQSEPTLIGSATLGERDGTANTYPWPYLGIAAYYEDDFFDGLQSVEVTYTSDNFFFIAIGTVQNGDTIDYAFRLPAAPGGNTVDIPLGSFQAPRWRWDATWGGELEERYLTDVAESAINPGITFTITSDPTTGETYENGSVNFTVSSVKIHREGGDGSSIVERGASRSARRANTLAITGFSAGRLGLNVPTAGNYTIAIYSVDGRLLSQTKANLAQGAHSLAIGRDLARGVAIVRVQGANTQLIRRVSIR
jgi:peptidoglycan/xylan/chitin deacetylase (PgdA/CDA1 family)